MQSEVCTFKVENTGTTSIDYSVYLDDTDELTTDERMNDKYVKFGLIKNDGDPKIGELPTTGVNPDRVLTIDTYKLRVWINQTAPEDSSCLLSIYTATSITGLENLDTSKVTNMYGFFIGVKATSLDISSLDTSNVTNMKRN